MAQHYTRTTVSAAAWCKKCGKETQHRIDGVKLGPCMVCLDKLENAPKREPEARQIGLFECEQEVK